MHLQLCRASAQGRVPVPGRRVPRLQVGELGVLPGLVSPGRTRLPAPRANLRLAGWGSSSSFPPSSASPDPVQGGAIVTDTIPVLQPLQFANKTSSVARARSLLNIYESFL